MAITLFDRVRHPKFRKGIVLFCLFCLTVALQVRFGFWLYDNYAYYKMFQHVLAITESLRSRRPEGQSEAAWDHALDCVQGAQGEVFLPENTSFARLQAYEAALQEKLQGPVDAGIFEWICDQLESTGPAGKQYVDQVRPQFRASIPAR
jgi:hypothetical protein